MNFYENVKDEELIERLRNGESEIMDYIMEKYKFLVRKRANAMYLIGAESEDVIQEGMIGLFKAIRDFSKEKESSFYHFADLCISRQIYKAIEASNRKKHQPLNTSVSLDGESCEDGKAFIDMVISMNSQDPEQMVIDHETLLGLHEKVNQSLSKMEQQVMEYYLAGMHYREIAEKMDKTPKSIDNALGRIKAKLSVIGKESI